MRGSRRASAARHKAPRGRLPLERSFNSFGLSDTRDRILAAALRLFATKGYGSTSVADILQTADVNAGSLYHFFPGKQDVFLAVLDAYLAGIGPNAARPGVGRRRRSDRPRLRAPRGATARRCCSPTAPTAVRSACLALELPSPTRRCARASPRTSTPGSRRSSAASSTPALGCRGTSTAERWRCSRSRPWKGGWGCRPHAPHPGRVRRRRPHAPNHVARLEAAAAA